MSNTNVIAAAWIVRPAAPPHLVRHCPTCGTARAFGSSGRMRLNANGKRLDAWLIYRCLRCDQTWNRPIIERASLRDIAPDDLEALQQNAPAWVRRHAFDLETLQAHASRIQHSENFSIHVPAPVICPKEWSVIRLSIRPEAPTGLRLDRILCTGLHVSRSHLKALTRAGAITVTPQTNSALRRPLRAAVTVTCKREVLPAEVCAKLVRAIVAPCSDQVRDREAGQDAEEARDP